MDIRLPIILDLSVPVKFRLIRYRLYALTIELVSIRSQNFVCDIGVYTLTVYEQSLVAIRYYSFCFDSAHVQIEEDVLNSSRGSHCSVTTDSRQL